MPYSEVKEIGFFSLTDHVSKQEHENGSAFTEYIEDELVKMRKDVSDMPENIIMASYKWVDEDSDEEGREFCYSWQALLSVPFLTAREIPLSKTSI